MHTFNTGWKFFFSTRSFNEIIVTEKPNPGSFAIFLRSSLLTDQSGLRKFVKYIIKALLMINKLILIFYEKIQIGNFKSEIVCLTALVGIVKIVDDVALSLW